MIGDGLACGHPASERNTLLTPGNNPGEVRERCRACNRRYDAARRARHGDKIRARRREQWAARTPEPMAADDPRHGTFAGYNKGKCRCEDCMAAMRQYHRVHRLKKKAAAMGIVLPPDLAGRGSTRPRDVISLDLVAEAALGMDRVLIGSEWDDPTAEAALC